MSPPSATTWYPARGHGDPRAGAARDLGDHGARALVDEEQRLLHGAERFDAGRGIHLAHDDVAERAGPAGLLDVPEVGRLGGGAGVDEAVELGQRDGAVPVGVGGPAGAGDEEVREQGSPAPIDLERRFFCAARRHPRLVHGRDELGGCVGHRHEGGALAAQDLARLAGVDDQHALLGGHHARGGLERRERQRLAREVQAVGAGVARVVHPELDRAPSRVDRRGADHGLAEGRGERVDGGLGHEPHVLRVDPAELRQHVAHPRGVAVGVGQGGVGGRAVVGRGDHREPHRGGLRRGQEGDHGPLVSSYTNRSGPRWAGTSGSQPRSVSSVGRSLENVTTSHSLPS